ncbi:hypothetical protein ACWEFL_33035 [Streptomyces sp. NPDC004838]
MSQQLSRRGILRTSAGIGTGLLVTSGLLGTDSAHAATASHDFVQRANDLWYTFDQETFYDPTPDFARAMGELREKLGNEVEGTLLTSWRYHMQAGTYPQTFAARMQEFKPQLAVVSRTQLGLFDRFFKNDFPGLVHAFAAFGQGTLYDPRSPVGARVHTMNYGEDGSPPLGYHIWHVFARAMAETGVDTKRWNRINPLIGLAWALQTAAKPSTDSPNKPLPFKVTAKLARTWLTKNQSELDQEFMSIPYPKGTAVA